MTWATRRSGTVAALVFQGATCRRGQATAACVEIHAVATREIRLRCTHLEGVRVAAIVDELAARGGIGRRFGKNSELDVFLVSDRHAPGYVEIAGHVELDNEPIPA